MMHPIGAKRPQRIILYGVFAIMDKARLIKLGITAAALFATYKFVKNDMVRAAVLGVAGVVVMKNTPFINQYVAV